MEKGCGERCFKIKPECGHKCMVPCHPNKPCPSTPCEAELRVYCSCGNKWVEVTCKSNPNRPPIDCDSRCWKKQRDARIATAFSSSQDFAANKDKIKFEYYNPVTQRDVIAGDIASWLNDHPKWRQWLVK